MRRIACVAIATTLLLTTSGSRSAKAAFSDFDPHKGTVVPDGAAAMFRFRASLGGDTRARAQPTFALTAGPVWRDEGASPFSPRRVGVSSAVEIGVTLSRQPVVKFGGIDLVDAQPSRLKAEGESDHHMLWVLLGTTAAVAALWGLTYVFIQDTCNNNACGSITN
jgi:hypothetical protein